MMAKICFNVMDASFNVIVSGGWGTTNSSKACSIILCLLYLKDDVFDVQTFAVLLKESKKID
jgi:hypothetical protein